MIDEGKKASAFSLEGSDGAVHGLESYRGQKVVIFFYPKDNTPGCTKEACGFRDYGSELKKLGVVVLGVSKDSLKSHDKFIADHQLNFPLLSDPDKSMMIEYGAWGKKMMYGKEVEGAIRSTVLINEEGVVLKHWPKVRKAEAHPDEVVAFLRG